MSGSLGGQVVSAGGASKAAADIERAAAQVGNPTECQKSTLGFVFTAADIERAPPQVGVLPTQQKIPQPNNWARRRTGAVL